MNRLLFTITTLALLASVADEATAQRRGGRGPGNAAGPRAQRTEQVPPQAPSQAPRQGRGQGAGAQPLRRFCAGPGGGGACVAAETITTPVAERAALVERLQPVLADELYARDVYRAASDALGLPRYANLARAEQNHADSIAALIERLGGTPVLAHGRAVEAPADLATAAARGDEIERQVIAAYDGLLADVTDPGVRAVLERIQQANRMHLDAVGAAAPQPGAGRGAGRGGGRGRGRGRW